MAETHYLVPPEESGEDAANGKMGFLEHLDELRTRLIRSCLAIAAGMLVSQVTAVLPWTDTISTRPR